MAIKQFTLESLRDLDGGRALEAFGLHIKRATLDCEDRPGDPKPRKVTLTFSLVPVLDPDLQCSEVKGQLHSASTVPPHRTKEYSFGLRRGGMLVFNDDSPTNINQGSLLDDDEA